MALRALNSPSFSPKDKDIHSLDCWTNIETRTKRPRFDNSPTEEEYLALCLLMLAKDTTTTTIVTTAAVAHNDELKLSYKCKVCNKTFLSYQALGGHKASHHKKFTPEVDQLSVVAVAKPIPSSVSLSGKVHACSICHRCFPSGQALGGHKRRHYDGGSGGGGSNSDGNQEGIKNLTGSQRDFDLNLPAMPEFSPVIVDRKRKSQLSGKYGAVESLSTDMYH